MTRTFVVEAGGYMTHLHFDDDVEFFYDPPVWLEAGVKYAFDIKTGVLTQQVTRDFIECIAAPKPRVLH